MISDGMIDPGGLQRMLREMSQQKEGDEYTVIALSAQRILNNLGANDAGYNVRSKLIQKNGKYRVAVEVRRRIGKFRRVE